MGALIAMAAGTVLSSVMGANAAGQEAAKNRIAFEEAEFKRDMQNQIENRNIANANAAKWMNNRRIATAANKSRAENDYWIKYNFANSAGVHGKKTHQLNGYLANSLYSKNINPRSGTARALLRAVSEDSKQQMSAMRINAANQLIASERKQAAALASRDFGFNSQVMQTPNRFMGMSGSDAFSSSLTAGLAQGAINVAGTYYMGQQYGATPPAGGGVGGGSGTGTAASTANLGAGGGQSGI